MLLPVHQLQRKAAWHARRLQLTAVGGALFAIAGAFLTAAIWMAIRGELGPIMASLIVGTLFAATGGLVMYLRRSRPEPTVPTISQQFRSAGSKGTLYQPRGQFPPLLEAFLFGASTYLQLRDRTRR